MRSVLARLGGTVLLRPYVFLFLLVHAGTSGRALGARRAAALSAIVWATALAAEGASTRVGFPFGYYVYTGATRERELFLGNVPFFDPLSFPFLAWAAYALALVLTAPRSAPAWPPALARRTAPGTLGLAVLGFVLIDVIIDPLAVRGDRWFLGKIFEYPSGGSYFGVPVSNFGGWALVGAVGLRLYAALDRRWEAAGLSLPAAGPGPFAAGAALWFGVAAFTLAVTFAIGEASLGVLGLGVAGSMAAALALRRARAGRDPAPGAMRLPGGGARAWQEDRSFP